MPFAAQAENWRLTPSIRVYEEYTDNVNLSATDKKGDLVTQVAPALSLDGNGRRLKLNATYRASAYLYASESERSRIDSTFSGNSTLEAIENLFYIEGAGSVTQQFISPLGPQPVSGTSVTNNRYTSSTWSINPYIRGRTPSDITYSLRNNNRWTLISGVGSSVALSNAYTQEWIGNVATPIYTFGAAVDYIKRDVTYQDSTNEIHTQLVRGTFNYQFDPQLRLFVTGGYEDNEFGLTRNSGSIYGIGANWRPTERTVADAFWEERFFGGSYRFSLSHRTPLSAWNVSASRDVTTYPQLALQLPPGFTPLLLNAAFQSRIPDTAQRVAAIQQFMNANGLPLFLSTPVSFYTEQLTLQERLEASYILIGARNTLAFTAYNIKNQGLSGNTGAALPSGFTFSRDFTQRGLGVTFSHKLTGLTALNISGLRLDTTQRDPVPGKSTTDTLRAEVTTSLGPKTRGFAGGRYSHFTSDISPGYNEAAVFAGVDHTF